MKLLTWNLAGRNSRLAAQVDFLATRGPDVVALQEVTPTTVGQLRDSLRRIGLAHVLDSFSLAAAEYQPRGPRRYGQLLAARLPLHAMPGGRFQIPWPERVLSAWLLLPDGEVELYTTHVPPGSSNGWIKIDTLRGLYDGLAKPSPLPRILCGDFNTPQVETGSGEVITWGQRLRAGGLPIIRSKVKGGSGTDWDKAERDVLLGLTEYDLRDVFRTVHGYGVEAYSWYAHGRVGRRFDHVFASAALVPLSAEYLHEPRQGGLSDHSAFEVVFAPGSG